MWVEIWGNETSRKCRTWFLQWVAKQLYAVLPQSKLGFYLLISEFQTKGGMGNLQWSHLGAPHSPAKTQEYLNHNLFKNKLFLLAQIMMFQMNGCVLLLSMMSHPLDILSPFRQRVKLKLCLDQCTQNQTYFQNYPAKIKEFNCSAKQTSHSYLFLLLVDEDTISSKHSKQYIQTVKPGCRKPNWKAVPGDK